MRRVLFLIPLALCGCRLGRQAAVSSDGRVASTVEAGTFISGRGKVAEGGDDVAWSPDGQTLAIASSDGVVFWPKGEKVPGLSRPLAWSPFGDQIAGTSEKDVKVKNLLTGVVRTVPFESLPQALSWTADGHLLGRDDTLLQIEGGAKLERKDKSIFDAVPSADGTVTWLEGDDFSKKYSAIYTLPLRLGHWNPTTGAVTATELPDTAHLFGIPSPRKLFFPVNFALAPDGSRFAAAMFQVEAGTRAIARLRELTEHAKSPSKAEQDEAETLLKSARISNIVLRVDGSGRAETLWTSPTTRDEWAPTDLSWSPDGKWLAIARKDGTVRVAAQ